jgi:hypothetical protein
VISLQFHNNYGAKINYEKMPYRSNEGKICPKMTQLAVITLANLQINSKRNPKGKQSSFLLRNRNRYGRLQL